MSTNFCQTLWKFKLTSLLAVLFFVTFPGVLNQSYSLISRRYNCNFDFNMCGWRNVYGKARDDFNWKRGSGGKGQQRGSGTRNDHGKGGGYMYIWSQSNKNRTARLISQPLYLRVPACFQFWYFMKGRDMGHLEVNLASSPSKLKANPRVLWNLRGHQGRGWKNAKIPLPRYIRGFLVFEAFDWERGRSGNILIDDVSITTTTRGCLSVSPPEAAPSFKSRTTAPVKIISTAPSSATSSQSEVSSASSTPTIMLNNYTSYGIRTTFNPLIIHTTIAKKDRFQTMPSTSRLMFNSTAFYMSGVTTNFSIPYNASKNVTSMLPDAYGSGGNSNFSEPYTTNTTDPSRVAKIFVTTPISINSTIALKVHFKDDMKLVTVSIVIGMLVVVLVLVVALLFYFRRKTKQRSTNGAEDFSIVMTRMYPELSDATSSEYRKLN